ncbi:hypothetical protein P5673_015110 [Acropora cervicornis]|uniref:Uncharacterized protein n=1 Tax=Acropora cervicornis TaxID=6130 RepID=A0AAD9QI32_ACRCE|nr:hypothetical protein P5673_015110 [Acropora cervicornis]
MIEALKVNKFGRTYRTGIALDQGMRSLIIDRILQEGGDRVTVYIPRSFRDDLELIEILKTEKPSVSLAEIISCLEEMDGEEVSMATVTERSSIDCHQVLDEKKNYEDRP